MERRHFRFLATLAVFFLISFNYDILHSVKIAVVVSAQSSGAEIIPFLKIWGILPGAFLLTFLFTFLSKRMGSERVFYAMVSVFLLFFLFFIAVLYPLRESLELTALSEVIQSHLPEGAKGFVAMVRYWHYTLFYLFGELWGNIVLIMLFWGFVNETTLFENAKRYYSIFAMSANLAPVLAGRYCLTFKKVNWDDSFQLFVSTVLLCGLLIMALFYFINRSLEKEAAVETRKDKKEETEHFTLRECFSFVRRSPYLRYIGIVVLGYYLVYNLTDVLWTAQVDKKFRGDVGAFTAYLNNVSIAKGILATVMALFVSGNLIRKLGWYSAAVVTPLIFALTCLFFFPLILIDQEFLSSVFLQFFSSPFINIVVLIGAMQNCLTRASKYTVFDATKEMAFIPLNRTSQRMGKAVIDGIGSRMGKTGGALILQFLLYYLGNLAATIPYVAAITVLIIIAWFYAIHRLDREIKKIT
ncbi:MAG: NTP/NDP exchange transporter [Deltaproteobacteria bacterium]|nr:NTP/NDP exchange transporter [Deltaproteobacteria bacterium]